LEVVFVSKARWKSVYDQSAFGPRETLSWYRKRSKIIAMKKDEFDTAIVSMFPYGSGENIRVLELGSGTGNLTAKIFRSFPQASITCIDGSSEMLKAAEARLRRHKGQIVFLRRNLEDPSWNTSLDRFHVIASARTLHHLSDQRKRALYKQIFDMLMKGSCFVNGDLIKSEHDILNRKYEEIWARHIKKKTKEILGIDRSIEEVKQKIHEAAAKEGDRPASVEDQLGWLRESGFKAVDCVWKYFHMAVVVGFK